MVCFQMVKSVHIVTFFYALGLQAAADDGTFPKETTFTMPPKEEPKRHPISGYGKSGPTALLMQWVGPKQYPPYYGTEVSSETPMPSPTSPTTQLPEIPTTSPPEIPRTSPPEIPRTLPPGIPRPPRPDMIPQGCASDPLVITVPQSAYLRSNLRLPRDKKVMEMVGLMFLVPVENATTGQPTQWATIPLVDPVAPFSHNPYRWPRPAGVEPGKPIGAGTIRGGMGDNIQIEGPVGRNFTDMVQKLPLQFGHSRNPLKEWAFPNQRELIRNFMNSLRSGWNAAPSRELTPSETAHSYPIRVWNQNEVPSPDDLSYQKYRSSSSRAGANTGQFLYYPRKAAGRYVPSSSPYRLPPQYYTDNAPPMMALPTFAHPVVQVRLQSGSPSYLEDNGQVPIPQKQFFEEGSGSDLPTENDAFKKILEILADKVPSIPLRLALDISKQLSQVSDLSKNVASNTKRSMGQEVGYPVTDVSDGSIVDSNTQRQQQEPGSAPLQTFDAYISIPLKPNGKQNVAASSEDTPTSDRQSYSHFRPDNGSELPAVDSITDTPPVNDSEIHGFASTDDNQRLLESAHRLLHHNQYNGPRSRDLTNSTVPHIWNIRGSVNYFNFPNQILESMPDGGPSSTALVQLESPQMSPSGETPVTTSETQGGSHSTAKSQLDYPLLNAETTRNSDPHQELDLNQTPETTRASELLSEEEVYTDSDEFIVEDLSDELSNALGDDVPESEEQITERETPFVWNAAIPTPSSFTEEPLALILPDRGYNSAQSRSVQNASSSTPADDNIAEHEQDLRTGVLKSESSASFAKANGQPVDEHDGSLGVHLKLLNGSDFPNAKNEKWSEMGISPLESILGNDFVQTIQKTDVIDSVVDTTSDFPNKMETKFKFLTLNVSVTNANSTQERRAVYQNIEHQPENVLRIESVEASDETDPTLSSLQENETLSKAGTIWDFQTLKDYLSKKLF